jgi:two-component system nitrate/nitrite response regulator NarL
LSTANPAVARQVSVIRTVLASDFRLLLEGVSHLLASRAMVELVGVATDAAGLIALAESSRPQIAIVDMAMAHSHDVLIQLRAPAIGTSVVAIGCGEEAQEFLRCAHAGLAGWVARDATLEDLLTVVESSARGEFVCSPKLAGALLRQFTALSINGVPPADGDPELTARERQVAALIDSGMSNKDIARQLHIEVATVKNHVHHLLAKLQVHRRSHAAARIRHRVRGVTVAG